MKVTNEDFVKSLSGLRCYQGGTAEQKSSHAAANSGTLRVLCAVLSLGISKKN